MRNYNNHRNFLGFVSPELIFLHENTLNPRTRVCVKFQLKGIQITLMDNIPISFNFNKLLLRLVTWWVFLLYK